MKKLGLVGGISWTSTLDYYRFINTGVNKKLGGINSAECIIYSVNFSEFASYTAAYDWDATFELFLKASENLKNAGAEGILLCANTAHIVADKIAESIQLPIIDIRVLVAEAVLNKKLKKVGLLGTEYTMELGFYKDKLVEYGIEPIIPESKSVRDFIEVTLRDELGCGILNPKTKVTYLEIIQELIDRGAEGIILGCTEIPLIISQADVSVPVFDSTEIHSQAAVAFILG